ncbi:MAG: class I SAM-dependent methyltransferase, partial [Cyanobacteria bacterium P01_H01_bin.121]
MTTRKDTIFEQFLAPIFSEYLIDGAAIRQQQDGINWEEAIAQFENPTLIYPAYYQTGNFHGIEGGYLTQSAAVTYDPVTQYVLPPSEDWIRQSVIDAIAGQPQRILDLGCGTGSTTLKLKLAFPEARVIGLDLSPHMLVIAAQKAQAANLDIEWL